jgi:hypothetical protein
MGDRSASARDISRSVVVTGEVNSVRLVFGDSGIRYTVRPQVVGDADITTWRAHRPRFVLA